MLLGHYFSLEHHFCILLRVKMSNFRFQVTAGQDFTQTVQKCILSGGRTHLSM